MASDRSRCSFHSLTVSNDSDSFPNYVSQILCFSKFVNNITKKILFYLQKFRI
uniref:Uncharacterized protein n=1 Tax=Oryza brachyantha TaxID=4533 RepID=J3N2A2_ORYBR